MNDVVGWLVSDLLLDLVDDLTSVADAVKLIGELIVLTEIEVVGTDDMDIVTLPDLVAVRVFDGAPEKDSLTVMEYDNDDVPLKDRLFSLVGLGEATLDIVRVRVEVTLGVFEAVREIEGFVWVSDV